MSPADPAGDAPGDAARPGRERAGKTAGFRTVLFDLDGTLIDSEELILSCYRHTMETHLGAAPPDAEWLATMGTPLAVQLRDFARDDAEAEAMVATYSAHNERVHDRLLATYPRVPETVAWLRESGFRLAVVTSKRHAGTLRGLRCCGIAPEWFDAVVTADDPVPHKPSPDPVLLALERLGEDSPDRALFIGDSVWDLRAGRAAGTATGAALWGPFGRDVLEAEGPDHLLEEVAALRDLLGAPAPEGPAAPLDRPGSGERVGPAVAPGRSGGDG